MIPTIQRYIYEYIDTWPIKVKQPVCLWPLLYSSRDYNYVANCYWSGRVILWFTAEDNYPSLISKIMDGSLKLESIKRCITFQERVNVKIGYAVFPRIFDIAEISGSIVLFQEAVRGPNYEIELSRAIYGPERSLSLTKRIIKRQLNEMGTLLRCLQDMRTSDKPRRWGEWAYKLGQDFRNTCGFDAKSLTDAHLDEMKKAIDSFPVYQRPVLLDHHCGNIFPGPRLIDHIHRDIDELIAQQPAVIDIVTVIIAYFRAGPINGILKDWLYAIVVAITDKEDQTIIGSPVRGILRQAGFDPDQPNVIWAFIEVASLLQMRSELEIYGENPFKISGMKTEFHKWTKRLIEIQEFISRNKKFDLRPVILAQDRIQMEEPPASDLLKKAIYEFLKSRPRLKSLARRILTAIRYIKRRKFG